MNMNWHQRRHGWTCSECGTFNEEGNFNCDSEECEMDGRREERDQERRLLTAEFVRLRKRDGDPDRLVVNSMSGMLYRVRRFAGRVGLTYFVLVPGGRVYRPDRYRVPDSVVRRAIEHFFGLSGMEAVGERDGPSDTPRLRD